MNVQPLTDEDPRRLGAYDVTGRLGEGGQGAVYLGRGAAESVAIKVLHAQLMGDETARSRFVREVEVTKRVARFCTAQVLDAGMIDDRPYIVSEYVPGPSLQQQLKREGPRQGAALDRLAINTATALAAIHQAGVVHRDFKPGNVLMGPDGPVVIDFGISRALDASGSLTTALSQVVGTPAFMAPEQLAEGPIGPSADMFAWAVTMTFAATGKPAFSGRTIPQVINQILHDEPELGALDGRLRGIVAACLAKDPAERPTARSLMDRLMGQRGETAMFATPQGLGFPPPGSAPRPGAENRSPGATEVLPPGHGAEHRSPSPDGTEILPPAARGGGTEILSPRAQDPGTRRMPAAPPYMSPQGPPMGPPGPPTRRMPEHDGPGMRPPPRPPSAPYEPPPRRHGAGGVIAVVVAVAVLVLGAGVVWAVSRSGGGDAGTASPAPSHKRHHPAKRRRTKAGTPVHRTTTRTPSRPPVARADPYTPQRLCGGGYQIIDRHGVGEATAYLLYDNDTGSNCVVTMVPKATGRTPMTATLQVQGGAHGTRSAANPFYAGPIRLPAKGKCVKWGGSSKAAHWLSGLTHCGT